MNQIPVTVPVQYAPQARYSQAGIPSFLHVPARSPAALEAYLHLYVDGLARAERELSAGRRSA